MAPTSYLKMMKNIECKEVIDLLVHAYGCEDYGLQDLYDIGYPLDYSRDIVELKTWLLSEYEQPIVLTDEQREELTYYYHHDCTTLERSNLQNVWVVGYQIEHSGNYHTHICYCDYPQLKSGKVYSIKELLGL